MDLLELLLRFWVLIKYIITLAFNRLIYILDLSSLIKLKYEGSWWTLSSDCHTGHLGSHAASRVPSACAMCSVSNYSSLYVFIIALPSVFINSPRLTNCSTCSITSTWMLILNYRWILFDLFDHSCFGFLRSISRRLHSFCPSVS